MPVDSTEDNYTQLLPNYHNDRKSEECTVTDDSETTNQSDSINNMKDSYIIAKTDVQKTNNIVNGNGNEQELLDSHLVSVRPKVLSEQSTTEHLKHWKQCEVNKWRRMVGFHVSGNELKGALFAKKLKSKKLRFAQAKQTLNQLYSYFSVKVLASEGGNSIVIGLARKDFPSGSELGVKLGSVGYDAGSGCILVPHEQTINAPAFTEGDIVGCGVIFPSHYRRYADLSTDDSSDGMTDIVLSSLLNVNKKSMDFVQCSLGLKRNSTDSSSSEEDAFLTDSVKTYQETDYYNENYTESRTKVEVYFTHNMQVVGKISTCVPIGGFFPTVQASPAGAIRLQFDFS